MCKTQLNLPVVAGHGEAVGEELLADDELEVGHPQPPLHFLEGIRGKFSTREVLHSAELHYAGQLTTIGVPSTELRSLWGIYVT